MQNKEALKRERILNGNLWKVIFSIALPLVFYNMCNYLYEIYDLMIVSKSKIGSVGSIAILNQIKNMISPIGASIAAGGCILVARKVGAKDLTGARRSANNLFYFAALLSLAVVLIFIPFGVPFLRLLRTPNEVIDNAIGYYNIQILNVAIVVMNSIFIGLEKARGNTKRLFYLNLIVVALKITLTTLFVYLIPNVTVTYVALATLIAQSSLFIFGLIILFMPRNILGISLRLIGFKKEYLMPIITISFPIFIGKFLFSSGKVFVNYQAEAMYGSLAVGALALSNSISGGVTKILNSFEDSASTITSQNLGNRNIKRTFELFRKMLIVSVTIGLLGNVILLVFSDPIVNFFIPGETADDLLQRQMVKNINIFECFALSFLALETAAFGLLYGYGKTRITMTVACLRLFLFRIPPLLIMMHLLHVDYKATGIAMGISNASAGVLAFTLAILVIRSIKKEGSYRDIVYNA